MEKIPALLFWFKLFVSCFFYILPFTINRLFLKLCSGRYSVTYDLFDMSNQKFMMLA